MTSCSEDPKELLNQAQTEIFKHQYINYKPMGFYPNPIGKIDTLKALTFFRKNNKSVIGYDFLIKNKHSDMLYIQEVLKEVDHRNRNVNLFPKKELYKEKSTIENNRFIKYSPLKLLNEIDWNYASDTIIEKERLRNFYRLEVDTIIDGNKIYTEQHIFLNPKSKLLVRFERRNYYNGQPTQKVVFKYEDYNFDDSAKGLPYNYPLNYKSVVYGKEKSKPLLDVGKKTPLFSGKDLHNKLFNLKDYIGKKIVLNFSVINCGYSLEAFKHFNRNDYQLSKDITMIYINPHDKKNDIVEYVNKLNLPFSVIPNAKEIEEAYGVSSYPTFFQIDEKGIIEKVKIGYDEEFLDSFKK